MTTVTITKAWGPRPTKIERGQVWEWNRTPWVIFEMVDNGTYVHWNPPSAGLEKWSGCGWPAEKILGDSERFVFAGWFPGYGPDAKKREETGDTAAGAPPPSSVSSLEDPELESYRKQLGVVDARAAAAHVLGARPALAEAPCPPYYPASS